MSFGHVLPIPVRGLFVLPLDITRDFVKYFCTSLFFYEWETVKEIIVDGICECGYWWAEHALMHIFELILFVGNGVYVAGLVDELHSNFQRICWYLKVQVVKCRTCVVDGCGIDW